MKNQNIQTEIDASYLYGILATHEEDPNVAEIFRQMSDIEKSHALAFMAKHNIPSEPFPAPSGRA
ncbi:MAG: rubrerythrin family protein, partial [Saprospiraceae bacterium]|nr:rubrerythrin family protein [Saprospiraceae bacterium]